MDKLSLWSFAEICRSLSLQYKLQCLSISIGLSNVTARLCCENLQRRVTLMQPWATLSYSARRYDSAVCCSNMSCDDFPSEALYETDKTLEKFAAAPRWRTEQTVNRKCMFYFVILRNMSINSLHLCLRLLCRLLHCCKPLSKYAARP